MSNLVDQDLLLSRKSYFVFLTRPYPIGIALGYAFYGSIVLAISIMPMFVRQGSRSHCLYVINTTFTFGVMSSKQACCIPVFKSYFVLHKSYFVFLSPKRLLVIAVNIITRCYFKVLAEV